MNVPDGERRSPVASWRVVPTLDWVAIAAAARDRMAGATRKLGDLELDVLLEQISAARAPRLVLNLDGLDDPDDLKTSELYALGPALQRALPSAAPDTRVAYRFAQADVAQAVADQFTLHSVPARDGAPAQPLLGLGLLASGPRVLGPLPRYLDDLVELLVERGELTAVDLHAARGTPLATGSDYLGELYRLRIALREREPLPGGGSRYVYTLGL